MAQCKKLRACMRGGGWRSREGGEKEVETPSYNNADLEVSRNS